MFELVPSGSQCVSAGSDQLNKQTTYSQWQQQEQGVWSVLGRGMMGQSVGGGRRGQKTKKWKMADFFSFLFCGSNWGNWGEMSPFHFGAATAVLHILIDHVPQPS